MRLSARARLQGFFDDSSFEEIGSKVRSVDALRFRDTKRYRDRLVDAQKRSEETEALLAGSGLVNGIPVTAVAF